MISIVVVGAATCAMLTAIAMAYWTAELIVHAVEKRFNRDDEEAG